MTKLLLAAFLLIAVDAASAQQSVIYGPDGKRTGTIQRDSQGLTVIRDSQGRVSGTTSTDSQGTTTIYGSDGRKTGSISNPGRK